MQLFNQTMRKYGNKNDSTEILHQEMTKTWNWRVDTDPELAASLGLLSQRCSTHAVDPRSFDSFQKRLLFLNNALDNIKISVNRNELNIQDQLSYDLYIQQLTDYVTFTPKYKAYMCCINRLEGPHTDLPLMAQYIPLKSPQQRLFYLKFLQDIPIQLNEVIELLKIGLIENRTPAQVGLNEVVPQIRSMIDGKLQAFREPINNIFPEYEMDIENQCIEQIDGSVHNAFVTLADYLENEYIPNLRTEISAVKGFPDGEAYYKDCLAFHTTTHMTPEEIHQLGLDELERIHNNMEEIASSDGYDGRLHDYLEHLRTSSEYSPVSAEALCTLFRDITGRIAPSLLKIFHLNTIPRMPFSVQEMPLEKADTSPAAYYLAGSTHPDSPRPGIFYVNTSQLQTRRTYESVALALHESIPGHHTQGSIQAENINLPEFRQMQEDRRYFEAPCRFPFYTGYIEGWGLHSETLGYELNNELYKNPSDKMGQLSMEAMRSCRLVVDTGIHSLGWTQEQAVDFMLQNTAMGKHDAETEVTRYIIWPGQATAYKVGERFLHKLRTKAENVLGIKFDPRDFYDVVLQCGPIPLDTLEKLVDAYIDEIQLDQSFCFVQKEHTNFTNTLT